MALWTPARRRSPDRRTMPNPDVIVTVRELYAHTAPLLDRLRRIELALAVLVVAVASPKVGGPTPAEAVKTATYAVSQIV